jgi:hypothetical protein
MLVFKPNQKVKIITDPNIYIYGTVIKSSDGSVCYFVDTPSEVVEYFAMKLRSIHRIEVLLYF